MDYEITNTITPEEYLEMLAPDPPPMQLIFLLRCLSTGAYRGQNLR